MEGSITTDFLTSWTILSLSSTLLHKFFTFLVINKAQEAWKQICDDSSKCAKDENEWNFTSILPLVHGFLHTHGNSFFSWITWLMSPGLRLRVLF